MYFSQTRLPPNVNEFFPLDHRILKILPSENAAKYMIDLILGGARSGKSALAENLALSSGLPVVYVATATAEDEEMRRRIARHRSRRPSAWATVEEPLFLADALRREAASGRCVLVECITLWLTNIMLTDSGKHFDEQREALLELLPMLSGRLIIVSNEVGMGIVPMGELSRRFQDEAGRLNQYLAAGCDRVILTVAGIPQVLKGGRL